VKTQIGETMVSVLQENKKRLIVNAFLEAAIAYELQGNWRNVFIQYSNQVMGKVRKQFLQWSIESEEHFNNAINRFLDA